VFWKVLQKIYLQGADAVCLFLAGVETLRGKIERAYGTRPDDLLSSAVKRKAHLAFSASFAHLAFTLQIRWSYDSRRRRADWSTSRICKRKFHLVFPRCSRQAGLFRKGQRPEVGRFQKP
jgi:hypothetical protein